MLGSSTIHTNPSFLSLSESADTHEEQVPYYCGARGGVGLWKGIKKGGNEEESVALTWRLLAEQDHGAFDDVPYFFQALSNVLGAVPPAFLCKQPLICCVLKSQVRQPQACHERIHRHIHVDTE